MTKEITGPRDLGPRASRRQTIDLLEPIAKHDVMKCLGKHAAALGRPAGK